MKRPFSETLTEDARAENPKTHPWKRYLRYLKWYGIGVVVVAIILASVGYSGAGWEGVKNGLTGLGFSRCSDCQWQAFSSTSLFGVVMPTDGVNIFTKKN